MKDANLHTIDQSIGRCSDHRHSEGPFEARPLARAKVLPK